MTQVEAHMATVSYLNYGPRQTNFVADYPQTVSPVAEVTLGNSHGQLCVNRKLT